MTIDSNVNHIINLLKSNKLDESLNEIVNLKIISNPIYENLHGIILAKKSLFEEAKIQFNKTIQSYPDFPDAYYNLAITYKEELNNNKKAIATFEELNSRYADNKYKLSTYFQLYRIFTSVKNQSQADYYKNKILNEYPNSEYAQINKNPKYISDKAAQKGEV